MTSLAPSLATFLREHLPRDRRASPNTCESYAYSFQLLVTFAAERLGMKPRQLEVEHLDVPMILAFLEHIELKRANTARSRNTRLAAIKSFFHFLEYRLPACLDQALRVHAIPMKKIDQGLVATLTSEEIQALLNAPDPRTLSGTRDRAMLHLAFAAGLRVSELVGLTVDQFDPRAPASIRVIGKGRRERVLPLWRETTAAIKAWLAVRPHGLDIALFLNGAGRSMTRSGFEYILAKHTGTAATAQPSIAGKKVSPHVLRHSCAMGLLHAGVDTSVIALWLGHAGVRSTDAYVHADISIKEKALSLTTPATAPPGRYRPPDKVLAFLESL